MNSPMELIDILRELYTVSGFRMSLYDVSRNQICVYPKELSPFCRMVQEDGEALKRCHSYDGEAFDMACGAGEVYIYRCHCGLCEAVAPLYDFGMLSGYLMMGQVIGTARTGRSEAVGMASAYVEDKERLRKAARAIPVRTEEQIRSCISIMGICARYISLSNYIRADRKDLAGNVKAYLEQHLEEEITLDRVCHEFYCSRASLTSSFRKAYGASVMEYLTKTRMERGRELLGRTDGRVGEVAAACGYRDQNYFCKVFKRYFGIAPGQVRKEGA